MPRVRLTLLGRPAVQLDDDVRPWPTTRPDALLTLLAIREGWVRREELALRFQPERRDAEARAWVRQVLHRAQARPWARSGAAELEHDGDAVRWPVTSDLAELRSALRRADPAAAVAATTGPLLLDWDPGDAATSAWVEEARAELLDAWIALVAPHAREREDAGDAVSALAAYRAWQRLDADDEQAVQGELRALHASAGSAAARRRYRAHARQRAALLGDETDAVPPPPVAGLARSPHATPLPVPPRRSLGREGDLATAVERLREGSTPWLTLHARAGMGTSLLGLEIAWLAADAFEGGAVSVAPRALAGADALRSALAEALGAPSAEHAQLEPWLRQAPTLLWLDAGDAAIGADAVAELARWSEIAAGSAWVVVARLPLGHPRETAVELSGLGQDAARALFLERVEAVDPGLRLGARDSEALDAIVAHVGGWPLALEVAAGWAVDVGLQALATRLDPLLTPTTDAGASPITRALAAAHEHLDERSADVLAALAAFRGPFDADAAEAVAGRDALTALARLRQVGLVERAVDARHRVHPLVASDAARRRASAARRGRAAHASWWAGRAATWAQDLRGGDPVGAARAVDEALPDLDHALDWAFEAALDAAHEDGRATPTADAALAHAHALAGARFQHATVRGLEREVAPRLRQVARLLAASEAHADRHAEVEGWSVYADVDAPLEQRLQRLATLLERADEHADRHATSTRWLAASAFALLTCANLLHREGRIDAATAAAEDGVARAEATRDAHLAAWGAHLRGVIGFARDDDAATLETWFGRALAHAAAGGDLEARALALANLGELALTQGDTDAAEARYGAALETLRALANPRLTAVVTGRLGRVALRRGDPLEAERRLVEAATALDALGDDRGLAAVHGDQAAAALARGDEAAARRALRSAVTRALDGGESAVALDAAVALADLDPDPERALHWLRRLHGWGLAVHHEVALQAAARLAARLGSPDAFEDAAAPFDDAARYRLRGFAAG